MSDPDPAADCLFCAIASGDGPAQVLEADEHTVAFMDINPATPGHALVIPRAHSADLLDISDADLERTMLASRRLAERMKAALDCDGINVLNCCGAAAWQTVFHFHVHVVPRYRDDPLKLPWIPDSGEPDEIAALADRIRGEES